MPTKKPSRRSPGRKKPAAKNSAGGKRTAGGRRSERPTAQIRKTAVKVLAGAAAGAVRAMIPQLEEVAGSSEQVAGTARPRGEAGARSSGEGAPRSPEGT
jgi:hypothetical protein